MDLKQLKDLSTAVEMTKGTIVINEGEAMPFSMYIILTGKVAVYKNFRDKGEVLIATLRPGEFFGEMSLFLSEPRNATVVTLETSLLLEVTQLNAYEIMEKVPAISYGIIMALCERIRTLNQKLTSRDYTRG